MFLNLLFPKQCAGCKKLGEYLCQDCKKKLKPHMEVCPYCHRFSPDYKTCFNCKSDANNFLEGIIIPFSYTPLLKKLIFKLKYYHKKDLVGFLVERLVLTIECNNVLKIDIKNKNTNIFPSSIFPSFNFLLTFVPSHRRRKYFVKGYNQSELLAKLVTQRLNGTFVHIMQKIKHTKSQASLDRSQRLRNLTKVFRIVQNADIKGDETLIIIDDITTTGATLNEMARIIKGIYPQMKIRGAVLGRHGG